MTQTISPKRDPKSEGIPTDEVRENPPGTLESKNDLAVLYLQQARYDDAEPLLLDAYSGREAKLGPDHPHTIESLKQLVSLYESRGKPDEAAKWRAKLVRPNDAEE